METTLPEWTSKKQVEDALTAARKHWKQVRNNGAEPGTPAYENAKAACVRLANILKHM